MNEIPVDLRSLAYTAPELKAGTLVLLSGTVYTARDAAHKKMAQLLAAGKSLPFEPAGATIYYAGPTGTPPGRIIGSCGPTTAGRMDPYTPALLKLGLSGMIGKGPRSLEVCEQIRRSGAVYFAAIGGAGALYAQAVVSCRVIAFEELGCESIKQLELRDFPAIVATNAAGGTIFAR